MKKISQIIQNSTGVKKTASVALVCQQAEDLLKEKLETSKIKVVKYQNKVLFLQVADPVIAQKVFQDEPKLKKAIQKKTDQKIDRISYRVSY